MTGTLEPPLTEDMETVYMIGAVAGTLEPSLTEDIETVDMTGTVTGVLEPPLTDDIETVDMTGTVTGTLELPLPDDMETEDMTGAVVGWLETGTLVVTTAVEFIGLLEVWLTGVVIGQTVVLTGTDWVLVRVMFDVTKVEHDVA